MQFVFEKYKGALEISVAPNILKQMYTDLTGDSSSTTDTKKHEAEEIVLEYIVSMGSIDLWSDLHAESNGNDGSKYDIS